MAWTDRTINILHDLSKGSAVKDSEATAAGSALYFPEVYYSGDSFRLRLSVYDNYAAGTRADFGASATAKLYCKLANAADIPVELAAGTIAQAAGATEYSELTFDVPAGATDDFSGLSCLLYVVVEDTAAGGRTTISDTLNIASLDGDGSANPPASGMRYAPADEDDWTTPPDDVAEALDQLAARLATAETESVQRLAAGITTVAGLVYTVTASGWVAADNAAEATAKGIMAVALDTAGTVLVHGQFPRAGTAGAVLYLDAAGAISETPPASGQIRVLGYQLTATLAYLCPSCSWGAVA